jgi:phage terminase large subunit-like protein
LYDWDCWARPNQKIPPGDWRYWLVRAGRGFGKTRVGGETVRIWARSFPFVNLIGATANDARDIMIEGESGILAICPPAERPVYVSSHRSLEWPNGARSLIFTADEPERLRGKQHYKLWCDELAAWRYAESWDQAMFGLRLGTNPQAIVTTTPRPLRIIRELLANPHTYETRGTTYDNRENLAPAFLAQIITKYEGTRLGRQELNAELLEDNPNALWKRENIDAYRIKLEELPAMQRIVVAIDPAVTSNEDSDETGIVVCGRDLRWPPHFYVLADESGIYTPREWGERAVGAFRSYKADRIIGEANNGGDLVEANIRGVSLDVPFKSVHAARGKEKRAEGVTGLWEQGRVHHVGSFPKLEDQMCDFNPQDQNQRSPDRMDALVWAMAELGGGMVSLTFANMQVEESEKRAQAAAARAMPANATKCDCGADPKLIIKRGPVSHCNACCREWGDLPAVAAGGGRVGL